LFGGGEAKDEKPVNEGAGFSVVATADLGSSFLSSLDLAPPNEKLGVALGAVDVVSAGLGANDNAAGVVLFSAGLLADERKPN
jgi:hypothetical protein